MRIHAVEENTPAPDDGQRTAQNEKPSHQCMKRCKDGQKHDRCNFPGENATERVSACAADTASAQNPTLPAAGVWNMQQAAPNQSRDHDVDSSCKYEKEEEGAAWSESNRRIQDCGEDKAGNQGSRDFDDDLDKDVRSDAVVGICRAQSHHYRKRMA